MWCSDALCTPVRAFYPLNARYASQLNQEMESGPRRIPVWKASVRKIINLNYGMRFRRRVAANGTKAPPRPRHRHRLPPP